MPFDDTGTVSLLPQGADDEKQPLIDLFDKTLEILGPNGERWGRGNYEEYGTVCLVGAMRLAAGYSETILPGGPSLDSDGIMRQAREALMKVAPPFPHPSSWGLHDPWMYVECVNDNQCNFEAIREWVARAKEAVYAV